MSPAGFRSLVMEVDGAFDQVRRFIGFHVLGLCEPARLFMAWAVAQRRGGPSAPFGGHDIGVSAKREGCSEAKPLGMPGGSAKRGRRAEGPEEPAGRSPKRRCGDQSNSVNDL